MKKKLSPGQIVEKFQVDGNDVIFRVMNKNDAKGCLRHINSLIREKAYIAWQKPFTLEQEREWVEDNMKKLKEGDRIAIVVERGGRMIGSSSVWREPFHAKRHIAHIAIGLNTGRGMGIGFRLMGALERVAVEQLGCTMLQLMVYEPNKPARRLYEKCGFVEFGRLKNGCYHFGNYYDEIFMVKYL